MIWSNVIIMVAIFTVLFTAMVIIPTIKHPEAGVHNYPPEIQEEYFKTHKRVDTSRLSKRTIFIKSIGILVFTVILSLGAIFAGVDSFLDGLFLRRSCLRLSVRGIHSLSTGCCLQD